MLNRSKKRIVPKLLALALLQGSLLAVDFGFSSDTPNDNQTLEVIEAKVEKNYKGLFKIDNFKRLNGYWIDKENQEYRVVCSYDLIAQKVIVPKRYMENVPLFIRLNSLKFNDDISKNEIISQEKSVDLRKTEQGWMPFSTLDIFKLF